VTEGMPGGERLDALPGLIGEIVQLASGSPPLEVIGYRDGLVVVRWDDGRQKSSFPAACLEPLTQRASGLRVI
jgi:uncharacterized protein YodC (DUF2158 family)